MTGTECVIHITDRAMRISLKAIAKANGLKVRMFKIWLNGHLEEKDGEFNLTSEELLQEIKKYRNTTWKIVHMIG